MTRDEAIAKVHASVLYDVQNIAALVDSLVCLGLLRLETQDETIARAAVDRLTGVIVMTDSSSGDHRRDAMPRKLTLDGAAEIIDVLTKSGFRITRDK